MAGATLGAGMSDFLGDGDRRNAAVLTRTSRSFSLVIQQLPPHLRASVCVFYLVLRALDTVEDDMEAFAGRQGDKLAELRYTVAKALFEAGGVEAHPVLRIT